MEIPMWLVYLIGVPLALVVAVLTFILLACGFLFLKHFPSSPLESNTYKKAPRQRGFKTTGQNYQLTTGSNILNRKVIQ